MKTYFFCFGMILLIMSGCNSYPRYTSSGSALPKERLPRKEGFTTREYVRFGMILRSYLGRPYKGKSQYDPGLDCSLFTREAYKKYDKRQIPRTVAEQRKLGREIPRQRLAIGDLVFYRTEPRRVSHVGVYIGYNSFIHATNSRGIIITDMSEKYWASRYVGARRILDEKSSGK